MEIIVILISMGLLSFLIGFLIILEEIEKNKEEEEEYLISRTNNG